MSREEYDEHMLTRRVDVVVAEIAGRHAYLTPGADGGVARGSIVHFGDRHFTVVQVTSSNTMIALDEEGLELGARGSAHVPVTQGAHGARRFTSPPPLETYSELWEDAVLPASQQEPPSVPLDLVLGERRWNLGLSLEAATSIPFDEQPVLGWGEARIRLRAEPLHDWPLGIDADIAAQLWLAEDIAGRRGSDSRPYVRVRLLQVRYGEEQSFYAALGRLRYAATNVGSLDGVRVQTPSLRGFTLGGFGGMMPNPFTGVPDVKSYRFGLEMAYRNLELDWRPMISVVAQGSVFDGDLDERRLLASALLFPGNNRLSAHAELSFNDANNPWNVPVAELSALGVDGSFRHGIFELGARFDLQRPERSLRLAYYLPGSWLCNAVPDQADSSVDACAGTKDTRYLASLDAGVRLNRWSVDAGATAIIFAEDPELTLVSGFLLGRVFRILGRGRGNASFNVTYGQYLTRFSGRVGAGAAVWRDILDFTLYYRLSYSYFPADLEGWFSHLWGSGILVRPVADLDIELNFEAIAGRDLDAAFVYLLTSWRPSF